MAKISGIVFLHKNYDSDGWNNHKLQKGELGLNLTTYEVRIGTEEDQSWNDASVVSCQVEVQGTGKHVLSAVYENGKLTITKGTISYNDLANQPTFKTINGESIIGSGNIAVEGASSAQWAKDDNGIFSEGATYYVKIPTNEWQDNEFVCIANIIHEDNDYCLYILKDPEYGFMSSLATSSDNVIDNKVGVLTLIDSEELVYDCPIPTISLNGSAYSSTNNTKAWLVKRRDYQELLISGQNIKTINGETILSSGDLKTSERWQKLYESFYHNTFKPIYVKLETLPALDEYIKIADMPNEGVGYGLFVRTTIHYNEDGTSPIITDAYVGSLDEVYFVLPLTLWGDGVYRIDVNVNAANYQLLYVPTPTTTAYLVYNIFEGIEQTLFIESHGNTVTTPMISNNLVSQILMNPYLTTIHYCGTILTFSSISPDELCYTGTSVDVVNKTANQIVWRINRTTKACDVESLSLQLASQSDISQLEQEIGNISTLLDQLVEV